MQGNTIKGFFEHWTFLRILRLLVGGLIVFDALSDGQWFLVALGAFLVYQALTNKGCGFGGDKACSIHTVEKSDMK